MSIGFVIGMLVAFLLAWNAPNLYLAIIEGAVAGVLGVYLDLYLASLREKDRD